MMTRKQETAIQFPIVTTPQKFKEQLARGRLNFVDPKAVALIEERQPYKWFPSHPKRALLMRVSDFDNTDKHRTINVVTYAITIGKINWTQRLHDVQWQPPADYRPEVGAEIGRFVFPSPEPRDGRASRTRVRRRLRRYLARVQRVVHR